MAVHTRQIDRANRASGFTLLEMMAVLVIIGILMTLLVTQLAKGAKVAEAKVTRIFIETLGAPISEYENQFGDYPPSQWNEEWGSAPNNTNLGAEALVLSLWSRKWGGVSINDDKLINTDQDETKKPVARFPKPSLFELKDQWDNPIAYLHHRDYGRQDVYITIPKNGQKVDDASGKLESTVRAHINPKTGQPYNPTKYQLISAGIDGEFGTEDDIGNWTPEPEKE